MNSNSSVTLTSSQAPQPLESGNGAGFSAVAGSGISEYHCPKCGKLKLTPSGKRHKCGPSDKEMMRRMREEIARQDAETIALRTEVEGLRRTMAQWQAHAMAVAHELDVAGWSVTSDFIPAIHQLQDRARETEALLARAVGHIAKTSHSTDALVRAWLSKGVNFQNK